MIYRRKRNRKLVKISKQALQLIEANGLNPHEIKGTGKDKSITTRDVQKFIDKLNAAIIEEVKSWKEEEDNETPQEGNPASQDAEE